MVDYTNPQNRMGAAQAQAASYDQGLRSYLLRVYNYMGGALIVTGLTALLAASFPPLMAALYQVAQAPDGAMVLVGMKPLGWLVAFAPLLFGILFGVRINSMTTQGAQTAFWAFAGVMGLSLASLFFLYTSASLARVFFITAGTFGGMSLYGYVTKRDLTSMGSFLIMGVWGIILASIVNIFLKSPGLYYAISYISVAVFLGLTAYDVQRIKNTYYMVGQNNLAKAAIIGAFSLYLDFINLFISLLRVMGDRR